MKINNINKKNQVQGKNNFPIHIVFNVIETCELNTEVICIYCL